MANLAQAMMGSALAWLRLSCILVGCIKLIVYGLTMFLFWPERFACTVTELSVHY